MSFVIITGSNGSLSNANVITSEASRSTQNGHMSNVCAIATAEQHSQHTVSSSALLAMQELPPDSHEHLPESQELPTELLIKLRDFCCQVAAPREVAEKAQEIANKVLAPIKHIKLQDDSHMWFCCFVYMASIDVRVHRSVHGQDCRNNNGPDLTVSELLQRASISLPDMFQYMQTLQDAHPVSAACQQSLLMLKRKYIITGPLYNKFEKMCNDIFHQENQEILIKKISQTTGIETHKRLCWTLFILAKSASMRQHCELVPAFYLLLCCMKYTLTIAPPFLLKPPYDTAKRDSLEKLCTAYAANIEEVRAVDSMVLQPVTATFTAHSKNVNVVQLRDEYYSVYREEGDINELLFLDHEPHLFKKGAAKPETSGAMAKITPVRFAMNSVNQLSSAVSGSAPSPQLLQYFTQCSRDPTSVVDECMSATHDRFIEEYTSCIGQSQQPAAAHRFRLASKLYYSLLHTLLKQEQERLSVHDFSHLLNNAVFRKCLLACSLEVVMATYETTSSLVEHQHMLESVIQFPWILRVLDLQVFDFLKVIESIIRSNFQLSLESMKHLQKIENVILEKLVWEANSSIHSLLSTSDVLQPLQSSANTQQEPAAQVNPATLYLSPRPHQRPTPHAENPPAQRRRSQSLSFFINKVSCLAYTRTEEMCEKLLVTDCLPKVWSCVESCLTHRTDLLNSRHLDQIIMCSIYAIFKALDREIKFKAIVNVYKMCPRASPQVYKQVLIQEGEYENIITFYNEVFMEAMKPYVMHIAAKHMNTPLSPVPMARSPQSGSLAYSLGGRKNFFVSPMKQSPFKTPISPATRQPLTPGSHKLYCFGEGPGSAEKLKTINDCLKARSVAVSPVSKRSQRSLNFDTMADAKPDSTQGVIQAKRVRLGLNEDQTDELQALPEDDR